ncbi:hypothetical protein AVEN_29455-1 [Araneus ventricosus]|uniref:Uncharacterized protein n=1 Tax=Araneus ventricosus TaxID=182803 RepID=A0A4Y2KBV5_ARAVE|nr:hypothetical protein AVEN_29455-1 [Araneus ventricosus]
MLHSNALPILEAMNSADSDDCVSGYKTELEKPAPKDVTKRRASKEESCSKEGGAAAKKPSKLKAKPKKKLCSEVDFLLSDNDVPSSQPSRQPCGGWWERSIDILKNLLRGVIGRACLRYEEMTNILCDCESITNSRPITYVTGNEAELVPLSPSMFVQDIKKIGVPECKAVEHLSLNKRVTYRLTLQKNLRKRFLVEFLGALLQRHENKTIAKSQLEMLF